MADFRGSRGPRRPRRKRCAMCDNKTVDYKDVPIIKKYINEKGKILPRRVTGTCPKHQRHVAREVKRARFMGLIPFVK